MVYAAVGTEQIMRRAGVIWGALYHQFPGGKEELLLGVYEQVEQELTQRVDERLGEVTSPFGAMRRESGSSWRRAAPPRFSGSC